MGVGDPCCSGKGDSSSWRWPWRFPAATPSAGFRGRLRFTSFPTSIRLRARIEGYPEVSKVKFWEREGGRPLTLTGIKKADQVYYLSYSGGEDVRGILTFKRNYNAEVQYNQSLTAMNSRPPQAMIDASWPVMKKIEKDLEENFGLPEITNTLRIRIFRVKDPERMKSN